MTVMMTSRKNIEGVGEYMGCMYSDRAGMCTLYDGAIEMVGVDPDTRLCLVEDDPHPERTCEDYHPDDLEDTYEL